MPAPLGHLASKAIPAAEGSQERLLDKIFGNLWIANAKKRIPVKVVAVLINPLAWVCAAC